MKPRRALSLLTGVAVFGVVAEFNEAPPRAQASPLGDATETARVVGQSPLLTARNSEVTGNTEQPALRASKAGRGNEEGNDPPQGPVARQAEPLSGNPLWALPLSRLSATRERPLFSPSRRSPSPAPAVAAPVAVREPVKRAQSERPTVALVGTIIGIGNDRMGIFVDTSTQDILRLRVGEDYHGWMVRLINRREATLVKVGEQALILEMPVPGAVSPKRSSRDAMLDRVWQVGAD